jgi:hypothetical protein
MEMNSYKKVIYDIYYGQQFLIGLLFCMPGGDCDEKVTDLFERL